MKITYRGYPLNNMTWDSVKFFMCLNFNFWINVNQISTQFDSVLRNRLHFKKNNLKYKNVF